MAKINKCTNPKCNKKKLAEDLFCSRCLVNLSVFTRLGIYYDREEINHKEKERKLKEDEKKMKKKEKALGIIQELVEDKIRRIKVRKG